MQISSNWFLVCVCVCVCVCVTPQHHFPTPSSGGRNNGCRKPVLGERECVCVRACVCVRLILKAHLLEYKRVTAVAVKQVFLPLERVIINNLHPLLIL